jgi:hypothetical protein
MEDQAHYANVRCSFKNKRRAMVSLTYLLRADFDKGNCIRACVRRLEGFKTFYCGRVN